MTVEKITVALLFCVLTTAVAYEKTMEVKIPVNENCTHTYSIYNLYETNSRDYFHESLLLCLKQNSTMFTINEAVKLIKNLNPFETKTMTFFLHDNFLDKYAILDIIPTQGKSLQIDLKYRDPSRFVSHVGCLLKENCTFWDEVRDIMTHNPVVLSLGCIASLIVILVILLCFGISKQQTQTPSSTHRHRVSDKR